MIIEYSIITVSTDFDSHSPSIVILLIAKHSLQFPDGFRKIVMVG